MDINKQVTKQLKTLKREFGEWVVGPTQKKLFLDGPIKIYEKYLSGEEDNALLVSKSDNLLTWHFNQYANAVLNEGRCPLEELALCARYALWATRFEAAFANAGKGRPLLLDQAAFNFSLNVLAGWQRETALLGDLLIKGLDTRLLDLRHTDRHEAGTLYRHFWFLLHLYASVQGETIDTSLYSYPDDMSPYQAVLADWRTPDLDKVAQFVSAMADFHVQEARNTAHDEIAEFDDPDYMLFPHEILTFLRLREWVGLPNPESFDHPLMQQPLAKLPAPVPLAQPNTPLLDQVIEKFKQEFPESFPIGS